jgi:hypothetical protein
MSSSYENETSNKEMFVLFLHQGSQFILALLGLVAVIVVLVKGSDFVYDKIYPITNSINGLALLILVPLGILLSIFRKTRLVGGAAIFLYSYALGFDLWILSLVIAKSLAGIFWLIVGCLFAGVGVIPVALIALALNGEWGNFAMLLVAGTVAFVVRYIAIAVMGSAVEAKPETAGIAVPSPEEYDFNREEIAVIGTTESR